MAGKETNVLELVEKERSDLGLWRGTKGGSGDAFAIIKSGAGMLPQL